MSVTPDYNKSIEFLKRWSPTGPWVLTSLEPDQKGIETRSFFPQDEAACLTWLQDHGGRRNIYFAVNPVVRPLYKKAEREDVAALAWLHVDIDPRAGEDLAQEQTRALGLLRNPPGGLPPPTVIVFSGGGYQGFWKLKEPLPINGNLEVAEDLKRYNLQIEILYGADHVHNIDRIMRLPGTINRPGAKKRKKGRVEALAELIEWHDDRVYAIEKFTKAPQVQSGTSTGFASNSVKVSGNIKRLASVDDLPDQVPQRAKVVIVQGLDPDEPNKFSSRSEWLFYACCAMVRGGCDDDTIFSVITDPSFGISASVLDKGSNADRYALRQIERAREEAIDPDLRKMNEKHAVIGNWNGKCRVIEEVWDPSLKRYRLTKQSFEDFRNRYMSVSKALGTGQNGQPITKPLGHWWLSHENRRQYETLVFAPGRETPGAYNLWRGFSCDARPGDCQLFLNHLRENVCGGVEEHYKYLIGWMARAVQHPDSPGYSAVVMRSGQGTGKSFVAQTFGSLFGRHYMPVTDPKHLVGSFNAHLRDTVVLFGDEAFYAGDKKHESILKMLITEELLTIEAKHVDAETSPNYVHLLMASNNEWVVPAGLDDRRFFVLDVAESKKNDHEYFQAIQRQMDNGGREALLHFLLTYDLTGFNVRNVPKTTALQQQKIFSFSAEEEWWFTKLKEGRLLVDHEGWVREISTNMLTNDFLEYTRAFGITRKGNATKLGYALKRFIPNLAPPHQKRTPITIRVDGKDKVIPRPYYYSFPTLAECRKIWDEKFGGPYEWPEITSEAQAEIKPAEGTSSDIPF